MLSWRKSTTTESVKLLQIYNVPITYVALLRTTKRIYLYVRLLYDCGVLLFELLQIWFLNTSNTLYFFN